MSRLIDTCIWIDILHGRAQSFAEMLAQSNPDDFKVPAVVLGELEVGTHKSVDPDKAMQALSRTLEPYEVVPFDKEAAHCYARIRADLEQSGSIIGRNDLLIAATALSRGDILVTNNVREFERVKGLHIESWEEIDLEA